LEQRRPTSTGRFRITYTPADFEPTIFSPLINVELKPGPDVYFRIVRGTAVLLAEPPSTGRTPARENRARASASTLRRQAASPSRAVPHPLNRGMLPTVHSAAGGSGLTTATSAPSFVPCAATAVIGKTLNASLCSTALR